MLTELFPFQKKAVNDLRGRIAVALNSYRIMKIPQVVSLQAPTGSGKTIIMASLIEDILFGSENYAEQPEAVFVWLSDSPQLNEQSRQKLEQKADRIRLDQYVTISDEAFDQKILDDGHIYFLNTQKLGKAGNLSYHSDTRQYTIWETIENTAREKSDRLYFIIDEAHRGMQGRAAGTATTIMQRFIKGSKPHNLSPLPVVIGMSATAERFNTLVGNTSSTLQKVVISPAQVRASGLLKDRIVITYPEDPTKHGDMAVLQAATEEWQNKCRHWYQYSYEQHYPQVNPVFVIQVQAGSGKKISDTNLDDVLASIEEHTGEHYKENEVVHTFGSVGTLKINGLSVPHVEPSAITDDRRIRIVFFKENLSTGWDCPRAETMMSFRHAEDATYIAQLLGRMVRTPLQSYILVDDYLNDVRLFLPYFNKETVQDVINELQSAEGGDIPTEIDGESLEEQQYVPWTVHTRKKHTPTDIPGQMDLFTWAENAESNNDGLINDDVSPSGFYNQSSQGQQQIQEDSVWDKGNSDENSNWFSSQGTSDNLQMEYTNSSDDLEKGSINENPSDDSLQYDQLSIAFSLDRESVIRFINEQGFLTYEVRTARINNYLKSLLDLAGLLTQNLIYRNANDEVKTEVTDMMRSYIDKLHRDGKYDALAKKALEFRLSVQVFDVFGQTVSNYSGSDFFAMADNDIDRQLRAADAKLGGYGFPYVYGRRFFNPEDPNAFKTDCILFAADDECIKDLNQYAEEKFHQLNDKYRKYVVSKSEKCRKQYSNIVADGDVVSKQNFTLPEVISQKVEQDGQTFYDHLYADENGASVIKLNGWETEVLHEEEQRPDFVCWLRNPVRKSWSLCIKYEMNGETKAMYPDFIMIRKDPDLGYIMDILDPHNPDFKDNLGKAKGLASYAVNEPRIGRVQLIRMGKNAAGKVRLKRLDFSRGAVRNKVLMATNNDELDHIFDTDGEFQDE